MLRSQVRQGYVIHKVGRVRLGDFNTIGTYANYDKYDFTMVHKCMSAWFHMSIHYYTIPLRRVFCQNWSQIVMASWKLKWLKWLLITSTGYNWETKPSFTWRHLLLSSWPSTNASWKKGLLACSENSHGTIATVIMLPVFVIQQISYRSLPCW